MVSIDEFCGNLYNPLGSSRHQTHLYAKKNSEIEKAAPCDKKGTIKYIQEKEKVYGGGGGEVKEGLLGTPLPL